MGIPLLQKARIGAYIVRQQLARRRREVGVDAAEETNVLPSSIIEEMRICVAREASEHGYACGSVHEEALPLALRSGER